MNIQSSRIQAAAAPKAPAKSNTITINLPSTDVSVDDVYEKGWNALDSIASGLYKAPGSLMIGMASAVPGMGLMVADEMKDHVGPETSSFTKLANLTTGAAQVAGLGTLGVTGLSALTGVGPTVGLLMTSGVFFGVAGVAGLSANFETGYM